MNEACGDIEILILAAGASRRMGMRDKLALLLPGGEALLRHVVRRALASGAQVRVALPAQDARRHALTAGLEAQPVAVADPGEGMAASLRAGIARIPGSTAALVVALADMPDVTTEDYLRLFKAFRDDPDANIQRAAASDGRPGNPVLLPRWAFADQVFTGDQGARAVLRSHPDKVRLVALPDNHAINDIDTAQDWHRWNARNA